VSKPQTSRNAVASAVNSIEHRGTLRSWPTLAALTLLVLTSLYAVYTLTASVDKSQNPKPKTETAHTPLEIQSRLSALHHRLTESATNDTAISLLSAEFSNLRALISELAKDDEIRVRELGPTLSGELDQLARLMTLTNASVTQTPVSIGSLGLKRISRMMKANAHVMSAISLEKQNEIVRVQR